jgi:hypothetical protein
VTKAERLAKTRAVYARMFLGDDGKPNPDGLFVLLELRKFCGVDKRFSTETNVAYHQIGMRTVYDHIEQMLKLNLLAYETEKQRETENHDRPATAAE